MSDKMRYNKKRRNDSEEEDMERQERVLEQIRRSGRAPAIPSSRFHEDSEQVRKKRTRKGERRRLRNLAKDFNSGRDE